MTITDRMQRRTMLKLALGSAAALAMPAPGHAATAMRLAVIGQSLIRYDLRRQPWPDFERIAARLKQSHACFSNLEVAIRGPREGAPTRNLDTLHLADPVVLDCLRDFGITTLSTSNNHAFDVGTGGILDAIDALEARNFPFAGTGRNLTEASRAAYQETPGGRFAVVACATGFVRDGGRALADRAGVHEIRRDDQQNLLREDVDRMLASIREARRNADVVMAYQHNHYWERPNIETTPEWQRGFARACIDAGASLFAAHGPPLLHGIEMYKGAPLLHGLGSFIFQTKKEEDAYGPVNWQSLIVECRFEKGRFVDAVLTPLDLASVGVGGIDDLETRGRPSFATGARAAEILENVAALSGRFGYGLSHDGATGKIIAA